MSNVRGFSVALALVVGLLVSGNGYATQFPQVAQASSLSDSLSEYVPYYHFVVQVGNDVDPANTKKLQKAYAKLRKHYPDGAARFLRGLRFELVQKTERISVAPDKLSTNSPVMRQFVRASMKWWAREADEHLLRSYSAAIARR